MRGLAGAVGALMMATGAWAMSAIPTVLMNQFSQPLQVFFALNLVHWIASGVLMFLWSIGGPSEKQ